jgi:hypothetical protein
MIKKGTATPSKLIIILTKKLFHGFGRMSLASGAFSATRTGVATCNLAGAVSE